MQCRSLACALLVVLVGCTAARPNVGGSDGRAPSDSGLTVLPGLDSTVPSGDTGVDDATWQSNWYSSDTIHEVTITINDAGWAALTNDPYNYVQADATFDNQTVTGLGVRLRGKVGSFRPITGKPKFKFDFGEYVPGQELHGLKGMSLNNEVVDCSYLKEPLAYRIFRDGGIMAPRTGFAHVTVNDIDYGLYVLVEEPDSKFLTEWMPDDDKGQLYDGKYVYYSDGSYTLLDFATGVDNLYQLEEGTDDANAEIVATSNATIAASAQFQQDLDPLVDWTQLHSVWAAEEWTGQVDGYAMDRNNYRVYYRPSDGKMSMIVWDFDYSFIQDWQWGMSWGSPTGVLAARCWADPQCKADQAVGMQNLLATVDTAAILDYFDGMVTLTKDLAHADPKRECTGPSIRQTQTQVRDWAANRSDGLAAEWGLTTGP